MNIFILDEDPVRSALFHNNSHVGKMIIEQNQIVCMALRIMIKQNVITLDESLIPYKPVRICSLVKWASKSMSNIEWINRRTRSLCHEYTYRYNKIHKSEGVLNQIESIIRYGRYITPDKFPIAISTEPKFDKSEVGLQTAVRLYRQYYIRDKRHIAKWKNRETPFWWK